MLLSAYDIRRPTRDVDLAAQHTPNDPESVCQLVGAVLAETRDDGWMYEGLSAEVIRDRDAYSGVRVKVPCRLDRARVTFHVDVNVGDVLWPGAVTLALPRSLGGEIKVRGYPLSMILAEKLVTAIQRDTSNARWRDFADVYSLSGRHAVNGEEVRESIRRVAAHRSATPSPLSLILEGYAETLAFGAFLTARDGRSPARPWLRRRPECFVSFRDIPCGPSSTLARLRPFPTRQLVPIRRPCREPREQRVESFGRERMTRRRLAPRDERFGELLHHLS